VDGQQTALSERPHWSPTPLLISALSLLVLASESTPHGDLEIKVLTDLSVGLRCKFQNDITGMILALSPFARQENTRARDSTNKKPIIGRKLFSKTLQNIHADENINLASLPITFPVTCYIAELVDPWPNDRTLHNPLPGQPQTESSRSFSKPLTPYRAFQKHQ